MRPWYSHGIGRWIDLNIASACDLVDGLYLLTHPNGKEFLGLSLDYLFVRYDRFYKRWQKNR